LLIGPARVHHRAVTLLAIALMGLLGCRPSAGGGSPERARERMVVEQIEARGVRDPRVLQAMRRVPRHEFVPEGSRSVAYEDRPLGIGAGQTISQPYIVAAMTELARLTPDSRVLEVGTGSGYAAAVLAEVAAEVYTIEIVESLAAQARRDLERTGYGRVHVRHGDGYRGWPEAAPFDAVLVAAAAPRVPEPLVEQLALGGRLVIPVGEWEQELTVHVKTEEGLRVERVFPVRFVPMTGEIRD
jgi:protein-L-isoaspartate(D-aspartate) O-methyltransferase